MKIAKRILVLVLSFTMIASVFSGCSSKKGSSVITLDVYDQRANTSGIAQGWFATILKEKFNVQLNMIREDGNTYATLMEQGDLGDLVIWGSGGEQYQQAAEQGLLYDWNQDDLCKTYAPEVYNNMQAALNYNATLTSTGKTYGFGFQVASNSKDHEQFFYTWDLRFDLYKELGYPEINNLDDLFDVLVKMKELEPTDEAGNPTYALSLWKDWDGVMMLYAKCLASAYYGYEGDNEGVGLYNSETGEYYDPLMEDGPYLEMVGFLNKLFRAGLIDPDALAATWETASGKVQNGGTFMSIFNYAGETLYNSVDRVNAGKAMYPVCPNNAKVNVVGMSQLGQGAIWSIGAKTEYPDLIMQIINYLATPEGTLEAVYGPQGLCWYYGEDGKTYFTELGLACHGSGTTLMESDDPQYQQYCGQSFQDGVNPLNMYTWSLMAVNPNSGERYLCDYWASNQEKPAEGSILADWQAWATEQTGKEVITFDDYYENRGTDKYMVTIKSTYKATTKSEEFSVLWDNVTNAIVEGTWKAVVAPTEEEYAKCIADMIEKCNAYDNGNGYKRVVEFSKNELAGRRQAELEIIEANKE